MPIGLPKGAGHRSERLALALAAMGLAWALVWTSLHRGPWYDEFYTWFVTRPDRAFIAALQGSWLKDNHPPLFYMLSWLSAHLAGSIEVLRLINLAGLAAALAGGWVLLRRWPQHWTLGIAFLLVLAANETALRSGAELRSYFLSYCAGAVVVLALAVGWLEGELHSRAQRLVLAAGLMVGMNLHILTSLIISALIAPFLAGCLIRKRKALFAQILAPALLAGAIFAITSAVQLPNWQGNTAQFWIPGGFNAARYAIEFAVLRALETNPVVLVGGGLGGAMLCLSAWKERRSSAVLECVVMLGIGLALAIVLLIALHLMRPMVIEKYLASLVAAVALAIALAYAEFARRLPQALAAVLLLIAVAFSLWAMQSNAERTVQRKSWNGTSARLGQLHQACADSPVHIDPAYWNALAMSLPPDDNRMVMPKAYALMAYRYGFAIEPAHSRRLSASCPTLFWAEHDTTKEWDEAKIAQHLRDQGFAISRVWQYRIGDGWIAADRPLN